MTENMPSLDVAQDRVWQIKDDRLPRVVEDYDPYDPLCCDDQVEVRTAYGHRVTCTQHRRVFTRLKEGLGGEPWVEEKYSGFGVDGK